MDKERDSLLKELTQLCWFMRGGVTWDEAMDMSYKERGICFEFIEKRMKDIKDHPYPVY